ncbi:hypothetical protein HY486_03395 [Candidatus Woesearchaeota archaeon]|nr:hypothetical protein [Candidatus Woesearchaeota archaeon]
MLFKSTINDWADSLAIILLVVGFLIGGLITGWKIYAITLLLGALFAKQLMREAYFPDYLLPTGFGIGLLIGSLNILTAITYVIGIIGTHKLHKYLTSIDF